MSADRKSVSFVALSTDQLAQRHDVCTRVCLGVVYSHQFRAHQSET